MKQSISIGRQKPLRLDAEVPGDKSISHRCVILGSIAGGTCDVSNFLESEDCLHTMQIFRELGVRIQKTGASSYRIHGRGLHSLKAPRRRLYCGNSGTTMRLLTGLLSTQPFRSVLDKDASLRGRPMDRVATPLERMGADIRGRGERRTAPLEVSGNAGLRGITYRMPMASAQVKSALLLAGLYAQGPTVVLEKETTRDHTEIFFKKTGIPIKVSGKRITLRPGRGPAAFKARVPGDISSAAFPIAMGLLVPGSRITLRNVNTNPTRTGLLKVLKRMGAGIRMGRPAAGGIEEAADLHISFSRLKATTVRPAEIPSLIDEVPVLMVMATQARGKTWIRGAGELRVKETDRIRSMVGPLKRMGARIGVKGDDIWIEGPTPLKAVPFIESYGDHRTAMSFIVAGMISEGTTRVKDIGPIATSFPSFLKLIKAAGSKFKLARA